MESIFTRIEKTLKAGPKSFNKEYAKLYDELRPDFIGAMRKSYAFLTNEVLEEAFQDAMHDFYQDVKTGKFEKYANSIRKYVFIMGRNKAISQFRHLHPDRYVETPVEELDLYRSLSYVSNEVEDEEKKNVIYRLVHSIGEPCSRVLTFFFYDVLSMREIAAAMGYKSSDVAKATKKKCMEKVKAVAKCDFEIQNLI